VFQHALFDANFGVKIATKKGSKSEPKLASTSGSFWAAKSTEILIVAG
jgi:hypothetical protein